MPPSSASAQASRRHFGPIFEPGQQGLLTFLFRVPCSPRCHRFEEVRFWGAIPHLVLGWAYRPPPPAQVRMAPLLRNAAVRSKYPLIGEKSSSDMKDEYANGSLEEITRMDTKTRAVDTSLEPKRGKEVMTRTLGHINSRRKSLQPYNPSYLQKTLKPFKETELDKRLQDQSQPSPKDITMPYKKMSLLYSSWESGAEPLHQILTSVFIVAFSLIYLFNASNLPARF